LTFKRLELRFEQIPALIELSERRLGMEDQQGAADALIEALSIAETARADSWVDRLETQLADVDRSRWLQYVLGKVRGIQSSNRFGYALRSESRFLVTLFSDVVGFTAWSSDRPADEVVNALNEYFCQMAHVIESCGGQIDKYIGDGLMVLFDGDESPQILATQACTCALGMLDALDALNRDRVVTGRASLAIRIGLNAGEAVVGNMGSYTKVARSAVGREVNLAARLEGLSEPGRVLCSESVRQLADRQQIRFVDRGMVNPKGLESVKSYWVERPT